MVGEGGYGGAAHGRSLLDGVENDDRGWDRDGEGWGGARGRSEMLIHGLAADLATTDRQKMRIFDSIPSTMKTCRKAGRG